MSNAFTPIAFLAGTAALAISVPALTEPPAHAPAPGYGDQPEGYAPEYYDRYADREFRYFERACDTGGDGAIGAALGSLLGDVEIGARLGSAMTDCDRSQFATATRIAFNNEQPTYWRNPQSGYRGVVHAGAPMEGYTHQCRRADAEFFTRDGRYMSETVTLCRNARGEWEPVD